MTTIQFQPAAQGMTDGTLVRLLAERFPQTFALDTEDDLGQVLVDCGMGLCASGIFLQHDALHFGITENGRAQVAGQQLACTLNLRLVVSTAPDRALADRFWVTVDDLSRPTNLMQVGRGATGSTAVLRALGNAAMNWGLGL